MLQFCEFRLIKQSFISEGLNLHQSFIICVSDKYSQFGRSIYQMQIKFSDLIALFENFCTIVWNVITSSNFYKLCVKQNCRDEKWTIVIIYSYVRLSFYFCFSSKIQSTFLALFMVKQFLFTLKIKLVTRAPFFTNIHFMIQKYYIFFK